MAFCTIYGQHVDYPEMEKSRSALKQTGVYTLNQLNYYW